MRTILRKGCLKQIAVERVVKTILGTAKEKLSLEQNNELI
jgi:hypothetical protein